MRLSSRGNCALTIRQKDSDASETVAPCSAAAKAFQVAGSDTAVETSDRNLRRDRFKTESLLMDGAIVANGEASQSSSGKLPSRSRSSAFEYPINKIPRDRLAVA